MTDNSRLNALIARLKGGEKLTHLVSAEVCLACGVPLGPQPQESWNAPTPITLYVLQCVDNHQGLHFHKSFDAVMSLARDAKDGQYILQAGFEAATELADADAVAFFNPEPALRAMLITALGRRTSSDRA